MSDNDDVRVESKNILDLPEEILLRIFCYLQPYNDYRSIRLVCRQWERLWREIRQWRQTNFSQSFSNSSSAISVHWHLVDPPVQFNLIPRFSHSVCYVDSKRMLYLFGGSPDLATTLNDFWRLDLSTRSWEKILPTGNYPPPKCASTLVDDENGNLILFGGRSMIYIDDLHIREQLHSDLHTYSLERNTWTKHVQLNEPGPIADHSASIVNFDNQKRMIVFGGLTSINDQISQRSNHLWQWTDRWTPIHVQGVQPEPRKGHSQFTINNENIFIVGGSSSTRICRDVWLYSFRTNQWTEILVQNTNCLEHSPNNEDFALIPFCFIRSSNILVTCSRFKRSPSIPQKNSYSQYDFSHCDKPSRNINASIIPSSSSDENDETIRSSLTTRRSILSTKSPEYNLIDLSHGLQIYRLDIANLFSANPFVNWLPSKSTNVFGSPTRCYLYYSLVSTRSELVLFGGIEKRKLTLQKSSRETNPIRSGTLAFITLSNIPL